MVGDLVSVGIPRLDKAKTDNKRLYCRIIAKPQPERHQLICQFEILKGLYPTKSLQQASEMLDLDEDIPMAPEPKLLYNNNLGKCCSKGFNISVSCTCKDKCTGKCRCINNLECSIYCHTKHSDHNCGNLSPLLKLL